MDDFQIKENPRISSCCTGRWMSKTAMNASDTAQQSQQQRIGCRVVFYCYQLTSPEKKVPNNNNMRRAATLI